MNMTMSRPWILVSPSSRGIGRALTTHLLRTTALPILATTRRDPASTKKEFLSSEGVPNDASDRLHLVQLDVTKESTIASAAAKARALFPSTTHHLHLALAIPGILHPEKSPKQIDYDDALETYKVNALGPLMLIKHFFDFLPRRSTKMAGAQASFSTTAAAEQASSKDSGGPSAPENVTGEAEQEQGGYGGEAVPKGSAADEWMKEQAEQTIEIKKKQQQKQDEQPAEDREHPAERAKKRQQQQGDKLDSGADEVTPKADQEQGGYGGEGVPAGGTEAHKAGRDKMSAITLPVHATWVSMAARVGSVQDDRTGGWYSYRSSKAAVVSMCKSFDHFLRTRSGDNALAIAFHPGTVATDFSRAFWAGVPKGKLLEPEFAAARLVEVVSSLGVADRGKFWDWKGEQVPA